MSFPVISRIPDPKESSYLRSHSNRDLNKISECKGRNASTLKGLQLWCGCHFDVEKKKKAAGIRTADC